MSKSGTITGTKYISNHYYLYIDWSSTPTATTNSSSVTAKLYFHADSGWGISISNHSGKITINGVAHNITGSVSSTGNTLLGEFDTTVTHSSDGTKSITIKGSFDADVTISGYGTIGTMSASATVALDNIDRNPPTVTGSVTYQGTNSVTIKATSSVSSNTWQYKIGSGSWTTLASTTGTSAQKASISPGANTSNTAYVRAKKVSNGVVGTSSAFTIDTRPPSVTCSVTDITDKGFKISATATYASGSWQYTTDGGDSWASLSSSASATSVTKTLTNLSAGQPYTVKVKATRVANGLTGTSSAKSVTTVGNSLLTSVPALQIDNTTSVSLGVTVYNKTYYHRIYIRDGNTSIGSVKIGKASTTGSTTISANLSTLKTAILNTMTTVTSKSFTYRLYTYSDEDYTSQIGSYSDKTGTIKVSSTYSAPDFTGGLTCADGSQTVHTLTGGAYIQGESDLRVTFDPATAKNEASIVSYTTTVGSKSVTGASTVVFGSIPVSGENTTVTVAVKDSRGFTKSQSTTLNVLPYEKPSVSNLTIARVNNYEETAVVTLSGDYSPVTQNGTDLNAIQSIKYHKRVVGDANWGVDVDVTSDVTIDTAEHTFEWTTSTFEDGNLVRTSEYEFEFIITDRLNSTTLERQIPDGTPVMSLRKGKVGINNPSPVYTLDVDGQMLGVRVYSKALNDSNSPSFFFVDSDDDQLGRIYSTRDNSSSPRRIVLQTYKSDPTYTESYRLPTPDTAGSSSDIYDILTTKTVQRDRVALSANVAIATGTTPTNLLELDMEAGVYIITAQIQFAASSSGTFRGLYLGTDTSGTSSYNAARVLCPPVASGSYVTTINASSILSNAAARTIYLNAIQNTGSNLNAVSTYTWLSILRLS